MKPSCILLALAGAMTTVPGCKVNRGHGVLMLIHFHDALAAAPSHLSGTVWLEWGRSWSILQDKQKQGAAVATEKQLSRSLSAQSCDRASSNPLY